MMRPNSILQRRKAFAEHIAAGKSGAEACRLAGFNGTSEALRAQASRLLTREDVQLLVKQARDASSSDRVLNAEQIKAFWTGIVMGTITEKDGRPARTADRIKAAELLAKCLGMFIERHEITGNVRYVIEAPTPIPDPIAWAKSVQARIVESEKEQP